MHIKRQSHILYVSDFHQFQRWSITYKRCFPYFGIFHLWGTYCFLGEVRCWNLCITSYTYHYTEISMWHRRYFVRCHCSYSFAINADWGIPYIPFCISMYIYPSCWSSSRLYLTITSYRSSASGTCIYIYIIGFQWFFLSIYGWLMYWWLS